MVSGLNGWKSSSESPSKLGRDSLSDSGAVLGGGIGLLFLDLDLDLDLDAGGCGCGCGCGTWNG